jgi:hypothetical protein
MFLSFVSRRTTISGVKPLRIGVLGSGKGSNFEAIADGVKRGEIPGEIVLVISDVADAGILGKARARGIEARYMPPGRFRSPRHGLRSGGPFRRFLGIAAHALGYGGGHLAWVAHHRTGRFFP